MENRDTEQTAVQTQEKRLMVATFENGIFSTSDSFLLATQMAKALAASTIVPKEFQGNWANCLIGIEQAIRMKMPVFMVLQNMYVIYGRPSWSSKLLIAMINGSGKFDQPLKFKEELKNGKPYACTAWTTLNGEVVEGMRITMDIAEAEGWVSKNGSKWKTMPQLMLRYRAASFFASLNCPEITMGLYTDDEARDMGSPDVDDFLNNMVAEVEEQTASETVVFPDPEPEPVPEPEPEKAKKTTKTSKKETAEKPAQVEQPDGQMTMNPGF